MLVVGRSDRRRGIILDSDAAQRAAVAADLLHVPGIPVGVVVAAVLQNVVFIDEDRRRVGILGLDVVASGIRDVILPGDMKDLMNKVTEAKKAAEANLISRREETAAIRSQANTAKLLVENPTLMRLRELEVLEKIASAGHLKVVLGEKGLADRVTNLL